MQNQSSPAKNAELDNSKPKRGRPKGAKTQTHVVVEVERPRCIKCKSTDTVEVQQINIRQMSGFTRAGEPYDQLRWIDRKCKNCGQRFRVRVASCKGVDVPN